MAAGMVLPTNLGEPVVPQAGYTNRVAQIDTSGLDQGIIGAAAVRGQYGKHIQQGLEGVGNSFDKLQLDQDQKESKDLWVGLSNQNRDVLNNYYSLKGDDAVKAAPQVSAQLNKNREAFLSKASNKQVSQMFDPLSQSLIQPDLDQVGHYAIDQHSVAMDITSKAMSDDALNKFVGNPNNDQQRQQSVAIIAGEAKNRAVAAGITDPKAQADLIQQDVSNAYRAAVENALTTDPTAGKQLYAKFKDQIQGTDQTKLDDAIKRADDAQQRKEEHAVYMDQYYRNLRAKQASSDFGAAIIRHQQDPAKYPAVDMLAVANNKDLDTGDMVTLMNMQKSADAGEADAQVSRNTLAEIFPKITAQYGDPNKYNDDTAINQLFADHKLTKGDWNFAHSLIDQARTEDGQKITDSMRQASDAAKGFISKSSMFSSDPVGDMKYYQFLQHMQDEVIRYKKENKNPYDLFRPGKDYLLSPENLKPFIPTMEESMNQMQGQLGGDSENIPTAGDASASPAPASPSGQGIPAFSDPSDPELAKLPSGSVFNLKDANGNLIMKDGVPIIKYKK